MTEKKFYILTTASLISMIVLAIWGQYAESVSLLFNVLLTIIGILAGFLTSQYFAEKSEMQNLGKYASAGNRLSLDIYDSLSQIKEKIVSLKSDTTKNLKTSNEVNLMLDLLLEQLAILQRFSLSANNQWRDVLPKDELSEVKKREEIFSLSDEREVRLTQETRILRG